MNFKDTMMNATWFISAVLLCAHVGASADEKNAAPVGEHPEASPLTLDAAAQKQLGVVTATVQQRTLENEIRAPGEVKSNAYATALVSPRIPAQVVRRHAKLGDIVKVGQALVTLSSVDVAEAQGTLIVTERDWQRVKSLGADAVSAKRYTEAQVARDQARAKLRAYGIGDGEIGALLKQGSTRANGDFSLLAPQAGRITSDDFVIGERIEPGKPLFTLNDEAIVWVEAQLASDAAERAQPGAVVRVMAHDQALSGKVIQLSHRTVEGSRTTPVRIEVINKGDLLHAGEFVEAHIATASATTSLAIPTEAIVQLQGQPSVFKAGDQGRFEIVPLSVGETRGDLTVIKQGLAAGDVIVVKGTYVLKARLLKSQLGEGE